MTDVKDDIQRDVSKLSISPKVVPSESPVAAAPSSTPGTQAQVPAPSGAPRHSKRRRSSAKIPLSAKPRELITKEKKRKNQAAPSLDFHNDTKKLKFSTLRELSLYLINVSNECPTQANIRNRGPINKVVLIVVPGINHSKFLISDPTKVVQPLNPEQPLKFIKNHFSKALITTAPGEKDSVFPLMKAFTTRPFTKTEKNRLKSELADKKLVLPDLEMSLDDLLQNGYPIHPETNGIINGKDDETLKLPEGWVDTVAFEHEGSHTFAMDCEMCISASGKVLTRVSMIDFDENVIIDELVKPDEEITDYLTDYSGITEEQLKDVTVTLKDVQQMILKTVSSNDYIIGHSLENDLNVLQIRHPKIIDTALVFEHPRGPPFKSALKYLTFKHLNRKIQEGSHDSIEDSRSCLDLVKLKLVEGGLLGKVLDGQSIFKDLESKSKKGAIVDYFRVQPFQNNFIQCKSDDEVVQKVIDCIQDRDLIIGNLKEIEFYLNNCGEVKHNEYDKLPDNEEELYSNLNRRLEKIYDSLPQNTAFILTTGSGDQTKVRQLYNRKRDFNKQYALKIKNPHDIITTEWDTTDESKLRDLVQEARIGVSFVTLKADPSSSAISE